MGCGLATSWRANAVLSDLRKMSGISQSCRFSKCRGVLAVITKEHFAPDFYGLLMSQGQSLTCRRG
jgi:hypothetical protein